MKNFQKMFFACCILLNTITIIFGMESSVANKQQAISVKIYKRPNVHTLSYFDIATGKIAKMFNDPEKDGHCAIGLIGNKWFFQPINVITHARIGPKIEIKDLSDAAKMNLSQQESFNLLVITTGNKNYLFINNTILEPKKCIPCTAIEPGFLFFTKPSESSGKLQIILANNQLCDSDACLPTDTAQNGLRGILGIHNENRLFVDIHENEELVETIILSMNKEYSDILRAKISSGIILSYGPEGSKKVLEIENGEMNPFSTKTTPQIDYKLHKPSPGWPTDLSMYMATSSKYIDEKNDKYEIQFNIAGIVFTRFIESEAQYNRERRKCHIKIDDIIDKSIVCFLDPENYKTSEHNDYSSALDNKDCSEKSIGPILESLRKSGQKTIALSCDSRTEIFLPHYGGTITRTDTYNRFSDEATYHLQIENYQIDRIPIVMTKDVGNSKNVLLILPNAQGIDWCSVNCKIIDNSAQGTKTPALQKETLSDFNTKNDSDIDVAKTKIDADQGKRSNNSNQLFENLKKYFWSRYSAFALVGTTGVAALLYYIYGDQIINKFRHIEQ